LLANAVVQSQQRWVGRPVRQQAGSYRFVASKPAPAGRRQQGAGRCTEAIFRAPGSGPNQGMIGGMYARVVPSAHSRNNTSGVCTSNCTNEKPIKSRAFSPSTPSSGSM